MVFCVKGIHLWHVSHHLVHHFLCAIVTDRNGVHVILLTQVLHDVVGAGEEVFEIVMEAVVSK